MKQMIQVMLDLQKLQLQAIALSLEDEAEILKLREKVPAPILAHFDRLIARGKKGVARAVHGVCTECHLQISSGTKASLAYTDEVHICDNCGRYLYLPDSELLPVIEAPPARKAPVKARGTATRQRAVAHAS